jgi:hypothetical protein
MPRKGRLGVLTFAREDYEMTETRTMFLVPAEVLDLIADESRADAYLVAIVKTALVWVASEETFIPADIIKDANRALAILARRARDRMPLPTWEVR